VLREAKTTHNNNGMRKSVLGGTRGEAKKRYALRIRKGIARRGPEARSCWEEGKGVSRKEKEAHGKGKGGEEKLPKSLITGQHQKPSIKKEEKGRDVWKKKLGKPGDKENTGEDLLKR